MSVVRRDPDPGSGLKLSRNQHWHSGSPGQQPSAWSLWWPRQLAGGAVGLQQWWHSHLQQHRWGPHFTERTGITSRHDCIILTELWVESASHSGISPHLHLLCFFSSSPSALFLCLIFICSDSSHLHPPPDLVYITYNLDNRVSNPYQLWKSLGCPDYPTVQQFRLLRSLQVIIHSSWTDLASTFI